MKFDQAMLDMFITGTIETFILVFVSTLVAYIIGTPFGILLAVTKKNGVHPMPILNGIVGFIINILRSIPFIILLLMVMPLTRTLVGTTVGVQAVVPPLMISSAPYIARVIESELAEVDYGVIEAARSMGASDWQIIKKVLLPEAKPSIILGAALVLTTVVGYSCMSGFVGGGGIGDIAVRYGYYRRDDAVMYISVVLLVILVQIIQTLGNRISRKADKRIK
jgi:D-methionine transport system permease protein